MPGYSYFVCGASRTASGVLGGDCARTLLMSSTLSDRTDPRSTERLAAGGSVGNEWDTLRTPTPLRRGAFRNRLDVGANDCTAKAAGNKEFPADAARGAGPAGFGRGRKS